MLEGIKDRIFRRGDDLYSWAAWEAGRGGWRAQSHAHLDLAGSAVAHEVVVQSIPVPEQPRNGLDEAQVIGHECLQLLAS